MIAKWDANTDSFPIALTQQGRDSFTVTYGQEVKRGLDYGQAAAALGQAMMHSAACAGLIDNEPEAKREPDIVHTSCGRCGLDIEGPHKGRYYDRGNNATCYRPGKRAVFHYPTKA